MHISWSFLDKRKATDIWKAGWYPRKVLRIIVRP